jgi:hypothetical protein
MAQACVYSLLGVSLNRYLIVIKTPPPFIERLFETATNA